ncbi:MAG: NAD(P)H-quinone oxidoreductase [Rhodothermales bacterium]
MHVIHVEGAGAHSRLVFQERPMPTCGPDDLLVRVHATALNRADLLQRKGMYPPPEGASPVLGLEMAGEVEVVGAQVRGWRGGDRVCALLPGGGYAQYVVIPARMAIPVPDRLSYEEAAAIPEVFMTAYQALVWLGRLQAGETVLIHAGASGVGTAAIQMARLLGARVYVTASRQKHPTCLALGAAAAIDYRDEAFDEAVMGLTNRKGVDVVLDFIGADYFERNVESLGMDGRLVILALMGGSRVESISLRHLFRKRLQILCSTLRNRSADYKAELTRAFCADMLPRIQEGHLVPVIDTVYDWSDVEAAHSRMEANLNTGKLVLRVT